MKNHISSNIECIQAKGVEISNISTVFIGADVDPDRISGKGVKIYNGCRISGADTFIHEGCQIGAEGPVTIENCQLGPEVKLKHGYFRQSVFLEKVESGLGSHVREGTIMEEQASIAHTVALKQTILFPFVTLGSLINFCDCLMAGGTSRKNHSEVGSSYIHFNFTPNQDKATASLMGDVPRGVMLNQKPIFLGGQGGIVGPCRLEFGTIVAAGTIVRKDELRPDRLIYGGASKQGNISYKPGRFSNPKRIVSNNIHYLGNLAALLQWYRHVRVMFVSDRFPEPLLNGLQQKLQMAITERCLRLQAFCVKSLETEMSKGQNVDRRWTQLETMLRSEVPGNPALRDKCLKAIQSGIEKGEHDYIGVIQSLQPEDRQNGIQWLQSIVEEAESKSMKLLFS